MAGDQQADYLLRYKVADTLDSMVRELAREVSQGAAPADPVAWMRRWLAAAEGAPPLPHAPAAEPPLPAMGYEKGDCLRWLAAAAGAAPPAAAGQPRVRGGWREHTAPAGHPRAGMTFYVSTETGEKRWDAPPEFAAESPKRATGGSDWEAVMSGDGRTFWHNRHTKQKTWDKPPGAPDAPAAPAAGNPADWQCFVSDKPGKEGRKWWYNARTGEKAWQCPPGVDPHADGSRPGESAAPPVSPARDAAPPPAEPTPKPGGWEEHKMADGRVFYYNRATQEKSWDPPDASPPYAGWDGGAAPAPAAPAAAKEVVPADAGTSPWQLHSTEKPGRGTVWWWYNASTGEKTWQQPPGAPAAPDGGGDAPPPAHADPAPAAVTSPGGGDWQAHNTGDGRTFWYNRVTKEKTWDCPPGCSPAAAAEDPPPPADTGAWEEVRTNDGRVFWYNRATKEKTWTKPPGVAGGQDDTPNAVAQQDWEEVKTNDGRVFWYNRATKEKTWDKPAAMP